VIGNDVVDLRDPESAPAALHPRFDARAFCDEERACLAAAADPGRLRWALWAAKEAAYKAARRLDPSLRFHPRRFVVEGDAVRHGQRRFRVRVREAGGALHAVAAAEGCDPERALAASAAVGEARAPGAARALALAAAAPLFAAAPGELAVVREGRLPRLLLRGSPAPAVLSLSHHGRFAAFALLLDEAGA
jgi:phosphopantetheinyl transferase (holo-ACP synthase)